MYKRQRDYVHVDDLSRAHIAAFEKLETPGASHFYNLGTGRPNSVREIIDAVEAVTGLKVPVIEDDRRAGDPPALTPTLVRRRMNWDGRLNSLKSKISSRQLGAGIRPSPMASPISTFFTMDFPSKPLAWMTSLRSPLLTKRHGFNP